ncbi:SDR family NAD(P)-dependent oxidoreductase [Planotetraspora mira]|jgi:NAD(P)-dependent dehydrogenase (short-subunit alcohol dehydrogenase family)|uniref:Short-chain dehydrogenase n=1 Tax=Planotetraspora mira TaxID=58121 RepID=A0A8J3TSW7_9ACTN|nr:SDR family NAD(P)-dependent oxidoreductase [Planotetraspora mira]GII30762.1 short-chain dehydrogenase [Planotetraspora mira]
MKKALITGASRGLGLALAKALADDGWSLLLTARGEEDLFSAAFDLNAEAIAGDITDPAHVARLAEAAPELDLLVNNASDLGPVPLPPLADLPLAGLRRLVETNVIAPLALVQATLPALRKRKGAVLGISSDAAVEAYEGWGGYGATKAALDQLSHVLAAEERDLAVWWVDPGEMNTRMLADAVGPGEAASAPSPDTVASALTRLVTIRPESGRFTREALAIATGALE